MEADVPAYPTDVRLFRSETAAPNPQFMSNALQETQGLSRKFDGLVCMVLILILILIMVMVMVMVVMFHGGDSSASYA